MAADGNLLQGEIIGDPSAEEKDVENLLLGFLEALLAEEGELVLTGSGVRSAGGSFPSVTQTSQSPLLKVGTPA